MRAELLRAQQRCDDMVADVQRGYDGLLREKNATIQQLRHVNMGLQADLATAGGGRSRAGHATLYLYPVAVAMLVVYRAQEVGVPWGLAAWHGAQSALTALALYLGLTGLTCACNPDSFDSFDGEFEVGAQQLTEFFQWLNTIRSSSAAGHAPALWRVVLRWRDDGRMVQYFIVAVSRQAVALTAIPRQVLGCACRWFVAIVCLGAAGLAPARRQATAEVPAASGRHRPKRRTGRR